MEATEGRRQRDEAHEGEGGEASAQIDRTDVETNNSFTPSTHSQSKTRTGLKEKS